MYNYETQKKNLYTDEGQRLFLQVRDDVFKRIEENGAVRQDKVKVRVGVYDSWDFLACFDRLVELKEIRMVFKDGATQYQIYTK